MSLKFYTDTHIPKQVAIQLRAKDIVIVRCEDVGMAEADDEAHLEYAAQNSLALITKDEGFRARHFHWLSEGKNHKGIFFCGDRQTAVIGKIVNACETYHKLIVSGAGQLDEIENEFFDIC
jgi:predicted nuclease of predicted toxin-antitoxin system